MLILYYMNGKDSATDFGGNIKHYRRERGMTQTELGDKVGVSRRMILHYEKHALCPPADKMTAIAKALGVSLDVLFGTQVKVKRGAPKNAYLRRKLQLVETLTKADQKTIVKMIEALAGQKH